MIFSTFYFSGTGNTKWAADQFSSAAAKNGHQAEIISVADDSLTDAGILKFFKDSDFIGFANPIYGADIPPIMRSFIGRVIEIIKRNDITISKPVYIINTFGYVNGFGPLLAKKLFSGTYLKIAAYANIKLCNNTSSPVLIATNISKEKLERRKEKAKKQLALLYERLISGQKYITGNGPYLIVGGIIRAIFKNAVINSYKSLRVNPETCKRCLMCVRDCPTHSISINNLVIAPTCTACMRCYNFCPTASIAIDGVYADPKKYHRYRGPESLKTESQ